MSSPKNILLVENDEHDQMFFVRALRKIDTAVLQDVAQDGEEALEKLNTLVPLPDIIFMDVEMPRMNGVECLEEIMKKEHLKSIPVVMLSSSAEHVERARTLGAKAFIKKPNDPSMLHEEIAQMINLDFIANSEIADQTFERAMM